MNENLLSNVLTTGVSIRGANHVRSGLPNQDAVAWLAESDTGLPVSFAVSDGHGSSKCFRSHVGSRLAVDVAVEMMQQFLMSESCRSDLSAIKRMAETGLPRELVRAWTKRVEQHMQDNPFDDKDYELAEHRGRQSIRDDLRRNPLVA